MIMSHKLYENDSNQLKVEGILGEQLALHRLFKLEFLVPEVSHSDVNNLIKLIIRTYQSLVFEGIINTSKQQPKWPQVLKSEL